MKIIISLCVLFGIATDFSAAAATFGGRTPLPLVATQTYNQQRTLRATGDESQSGNMTVAFVPLISIIANLLPRFFNRYASVPQKNTKHARSLFFQGTQQLECQTPQQIGMRWPDLTSRSHYYQCHPSNRCAKQKKAICLMTKRHECKPPTIFYFEKQRCILTTI